ncbi:MAG: FAD-dependent oxidoreductase [Euryarchaeota archaeon]|nr:FAD-dependent oxidoreductase [Euryarchaeota archaeon]
MKVVVVGGGAAGTRAAIEIRKKDRNAEITVINEQGYREYSPCGMPFVLSEEVQGFEDLQTLDKKFYEKMKIELILGEKVEKIDSKTKTVFYGNKEMNYDKLVIATGSYAFTPAVEGIDSGKVIVFKGLADAKKIHKKMEDAKKAVVIGAGLIGLETAYAFAKNEIEVTVVEMLDRVLPMMLDRDMAGEVKKYLEKKDIRIHLNEKVESIGKTVNTDKREIPADLVVVATGVRANTELAEKAGIEVERGIKVNEKMETSASDIYACGDCVESADFITGRPIMSQLATTAVRQAKVLAENITGGDAEFDPVLNTSITELFGLEIGSTGLTDFRAKKEGIKIIKGRYKGKTRPEYMKGADIIVKIIADKEGTIIGAQMAGKGLVGRMDAITLAIRSKMNVKELSNMEYCYAPPVSPEFEPMYLACEMAVRKLR